ncbi:hypothetical protein [Pseudonocardia sp. HH130630-07]|uniref:hypothetical protein n=1 Tax=Pseudonocardia sp. HH130630-07 TaxID=1690815 RepID=UPI000814BB3C|nr:hypothetical protein [Pseudonocardia sp. HH130630-07]ANY06727.1 hypothetical protein AFB00_10970 [Pseudonocardia sp. HH130630-07]
MSTDRKRAKARKDAAEAVHTLADAGRIASGAAVSSVSEAVSGAVSDLSGTVSHQVEDARKALAAAIDPVPVRTRRAPWIIAVVVLTGLAAYAWAKLLRREGEIDPGTPVPVTPPSNQQLHGKPIGQGPGQATAG